MNKKQALELLHKKMKNQNLRRHCYAVSAVMESLYNRLEDGSKSKEEREIWGVVGLLHDGDYEETRGAPELHTIKMVEWLEMLEKSKKLAIDKKIKEAILSHNFAHTGQNLPAKATLHALQAGPPKNNLEWALYCCDELTGLIIAVALVKDKTLASVNTDSVLKKWDSPSFAAGVKRPQIKECESRLGIPLREFIDISISAMQGIHEDLGM